MAAQIGSLVALGHINDFFGYNYPSGLPVQTIIKLVNKIFNVSDLEEDKIDRSPASLSCNSRPQTLSDQHNGSFFRLRFFSFELVDAGAHK